MPHSQRLENRLDRYYGPVWTYNILHSYMGPIIILCIYIYILYRIFIYIYIYICIHIYIYIYVLCIYIYMCIISIYIYVWFYPNDAPEISLRLLVGLASVLLYHLMSFSLAQLHLAQVGGLDQEFRGYPLVV